jgi:peptidoglycan/LPS O-acetylase OafA/YrhL
MAEPPESPPPTSGLMAGRVPQLDVLRGIAVCLVLVHHSPGGEGAVLKGGWTGVDLFFVLSGFLVSGLLFKEHARTGHIRPGRFYLRRGLKIYPNFYTMMLVTSGALVGAGIPIEPRRLLHEVVFLQNYLPTAWWGRDHGWSLAVEEHFYLLLPPVLLLLFRWGAFRRRPLPLAAGITAVLGAGALAARWLMVRSGGTADDIMYLTHTRMDALAFGVLLSVLWNHAPAWIPTIRRFRFVLLAVGLLLTAPCYILTHEHPLILTLGLTLNYLGYGMVLAAALTLPRLAPPRLSSLLAFVGFYSYSIYLWHLPYFAVVRGAFGERPLGVVLYYTGSIGIGVLMARLVELPALRLRERWCPTPASATTLPAR